VVAAAAIVSPAIDPASDTRRLQSRCAGVPGKASTIDRSNDFSATVPATSGSASVHACRGDIRIGAVQMRFWSAAKSRMKSPAGFACCPAAEVRTATVITGAAAMRLTHFGTMRNPVLPLRVACPAARRALFLPIHPQWKRPPAVRGRAESKLACL